VHLSQRVMLVNDGKTSLMQLFTRFQRQESESCSSSGVTMLSRKNLSSMKRNIISSSLHIQALFLLITDFLDLVLLLGRTYISTNKGRRGWGGDNFFLAFSLIFLRIRIYS
jgi:hypothetical protein